MIVMSATTSVEVTRDMFNRSVVARESDVPYINIVRLFRSTMTFKIKIEGVRVIHCYQSALFYNLEMTPLDGVSFVLDRSESGLT